MKKFLSLALILAMSVTLFAGCGSNGGGQGDEGDGTGEPVNLTFQYIGGTVPAQDQVITDSIEAFEEANPGVTIETIYIDWANGILNFTIQL